MLCKFGDHSVNNKREIEPRAYSARIPIISPTVSLNCYNAFVPKCGRRNAEVQVVTSMGFVTGLALAEEPTFHNVFRLPVNRSVPKNKVTLH